MCRALPLFVILRMQRVNCKCLALNYLYTFVKLFNKLQFAIELHIIELHIIHTCMYNIIQSIHILQYSAAYICMSQTIQPVQTLQNYHYSVCNNGCI